MKVQPFKCGPDYIDPAFHERATGRQSFNLDSWAMPEAAIVRLAGDVCVGSDIAIVEGVMGLFDGAAGSGLAGRGATADIAALLGWPVILVVDVSGQTETAAAVALGCARYRDDIMVAGVILNRVASERHAALIMAGFERIGMPVLGAVRRDQSISLPERYLGLLQAMEQDALAEHLDRLGNGIARSVGLDAVSAAARPMQPHPSSADEAVACDLPPPGQRIALAQDRAFSFIYPHVVRGWRNAGAEILAFSPLADQAPDPSADAVWLPGGYPELYAGQLAAARAFHRGMRQVAARGVPIHGECGGFMVLGEGLEDADGARHSMLGLLSVDTTMQQRRLSLGYRRAELLRECALGKVGATVYGHEFHYARMLRNDEEPLVSCRDASSALIEERGARRHNVTGTFLHAIGATDGAGQHVPEPPRAP
jgi:cobyrinic acid a,c-diamide synthase